MLWRVRSLQYDGGVVDQFFIHFTSVGSHTGGSALFILIASITMNKNGQAHHIMRDYSVRSNAFAEAMFYLFFEIFENKYHHLIDPVFYCVWFAFQYNDTVSLASYWLIIFLAFSSIITHSANISRSALALTYEQSDRKFSINQERW